jgi:FkbM family methyltransferase
MSRQPLARKARIWRTYAKLSVPLPENGHQAVVAGFKVSYFDRSTLALLYREIFVRQSYRLPELGPEPLIFDCGANLGMATLFFKFLYPRGRITCFEPDPATFALLQKNILNNQLDQVECFNVALWDEDRAIDFFSNSSDPGSLLMSTNAARMSTPPIPVPGRRLSTYIDGEVDFLKLDVEGAEQRVLQELAESGKLRLVREMAIEYHHRIPGERSALSRFLKIFEENAFEYQIVASGFPDPSVPRF